MKIGLLGGTFNPPHNGHLAIAQQVLDFTDVEEVWLLPNYGQNPPKPVIELDHRIAMCQATQLPVSLLEIEHKLGGDTIELLPFLPKEHHYRFIIGSDQLPTFHLWGQWEKLLDTLAFLVFPRYGYPNEPLYPNMTMIQDARLITSNISSTKIRERVAKGLPIECFVPVKIDTYIHANRLYQQ